jgi:hypothetical protein
MITVGSFRSAENGVDRSVGDVGSAGSSRLSGLGKQS